MFKVPFATYHQWKNTEIQLEFRDKLNENEISDVINNGFALNFEYLLMQNKDESVIKYLADTPLNSARGIHVFVNDSGFELMLYAGNNYSIILLYDFADFFTMKADYDECDQPVFDTIKYLYMVTFLFKNLIIKKIRVIEDSEFEHSPFQDPLPNRVYAFTGATYHFRSPYQYLMTILNNILGNSGKFDLEISDINQFCKQLVNELINNEQKGIVLKFRMHTNDFDLIIYPQRLILVPLTTLLILKHNDAELVDILYYVKIMMFICKDLGIRDMETYFNQ